MDDLQVINVGQAANDGTGDDLRTANTKVNANFSALKARVQDISGGASNAVQSASAAQASAAAAAVAVSGVGGAIAEAAQTATVEGIVDATDVGKALVRSTARSVADANATALATDTYIGLTSLTAPRTITLPDVDVYPMGVVLFIADESGQCSVDRPITLAIGSGTSDTIAGQTAIQITDAYQGIGLRRGVANVWIIAR